MSEGKLRTHIGLLNLALHLGLVLLVLYYYTQRYLLFSEMTTILAIIGPFFAVYTAAIVKYFIDHSSGIPPGTAPLALPFVALSYALPILFGSLLFVALALKATTPTFGTFDEFKHTLAILEATFGVYAGLFLRRLFELK